MRILIIEDDRLMARSIALMLGGAGLEHETAETGEAGLELARLYDYDAILLDLMLPDGHGYDVLRRLRAAHVATPVMVLTGDRELESKVSGFGLGADDYLTKPFDRAEFLARVHALVRRSKGHARSVVTTGSLTVDLTERSVAVGGRRVHLTSKEYAILEMLSLRKGMTLSKEMFLNHLYGGRDEPETKIIDVFICKLRKKLAEAGSGASSCIETVWGRGYALRDPEVDQRVAAKAA